MLTMAIRQTHARSFMRCKLKYKLQCIDRLIPKDKKIALSIGTACHAGRAKWLSTRSAADALAATLASLDAEVENFPSLAAEAVSAKNVAMEVIASYCLEFDKRFPNNSIKVLAIEVPFEVKLAELDDREGKLELYVNGTLDADIIFAGKYRMNFEYKTTKSQLPYFFDQEYLSIQHPTYSLAQREIIGENPYGTLLDASRKPLKTQGPQHDHIIIPISADRLAKTRHFYVELLREIAYAIDNDYFPQNTDSCFSVKGRCEYFPACKSEFDPHVINNLYTVVGEVEKGETDEGEIL